MEQCLRALASRGRAEGLQIAYSDMHGLWGGVTLTLGGDGAYERAERPAGAPEPTVTRVLVGPRELREVAELLLELAAWEQRAPIPDRPLVPDESWATLTIRCGEAVARVTEPHNDLGANQRLIRVRDRLSALAVQREGPLGG